jgi:hypothetical protein
MEGALPSVLGGLVAAPVIAVPTSVGYGASLNGIAALLSMLNSCASGLTVVNIDNGFGAAVAALQDFVSNFTINACCNRNSQSTSLCSCCHGSFSSAATISVTGVDDNGSGGVYNIDGQNYWWMCVEALP